MHYADLASSECHPNIDLLICATLFPACSPGYDITLPCFDFCKEVKQSCTPFIDKAKIPWPFYFDCLNLPRRKRGRFCINEKFKPSDIDMIRVKRPEPPKAKTVYPKEVDGENSTTLWNGVFTEDPEVKNFGLELVTTPPTHRKEGRRYEECSEPILFTVSEQHLAQVWIIAWSSIAISCSLAMIFLASTHGHITKPENIILTISVCLLFQSAGFLLSVMSPQSPFQCSVSESPGDPVYLRKNSPSPTCYLTFTATYLGGIAANLWWVTLSILWFLMLGMNWSTESMFKVFRYLHLVIGCLAGGLTVAVLTVGAVEGDDLSGGCVAGGIHSENLATYDVTPNCVVLCIGGVILACGACTMVKVSRLERNSHNIPLQRLRSVAVFLFCYLIIFILKILCQFYELSYRSAWYKQCDPNLQTTNFTYLGLDKFNKSSGPSKGDEACGPDFKIFMVKYTCYLFLPVLSAVYLKNTVNIIEILRKIIPLAKNYSYRTGETKV